MNGDSTTVFSVTEAQLSTIHDSLIQASQFLVGERVVAMPLESTLLKLRKPQVPLEYRG